MTSPRTQSRKVPPASQWIQTRYYSCSFSRVARFRNWSWIFGKGNAHVLLHFFLRFWVVWDAWLIFLLQLLFVFLSKLLTALWHRVLVLWIVVLVLTDILASFKLLYLPHRTTFNPFFNLHICLLFRCHAARCSCFYMSNQRKNLNYSMYIVVRTEKNEKKIIFRLLLFSLCFWWLCRSNLFENKRK